MKFLQNTERIKYQLGNAEETNLQNNSVDLITVASALHWLDHDKFFKECDRILKPGGTLAVNFIFQFSLN